MKTKNGLKGLISIIFLLTLSSFGYAAEDLRSKFLVYISVQEEYSDNINLTNTNTKDDFITSILPGVNLSTTRGKSTPDPSGIEFDYHPGFVFYAKNSENNYISHAGNLNAWLGSERGFTLRLRDELIRSDENREMSYSNQPLGSAYIIGTRRERSIYLRNILNPSINYQFGKDNIFSLDYINNVYRNESPDIEDSTENLINPKFTYWLNVHNGITLEYAFRKGDFDVSPDLTAHLSRGRYSYRFNPRTTIFVDYIYENYNFEDPGVDYETQNPSIGTEHAFSRTLTGRAQVGYYWQKPKNGNSTTGLTYNANLTLRGSEKTSFILDLAGGYTQDYFTAENLGFVQYNRALGTITHLLTRRVKLGLYGSIERDEFKQQQDRKDWVWRVGGNASYQILRWLSIEAEAYHQQDDSSQDIFDYKENRGIIRIKASM
jgi:hypothetical protein